LPVFCYVTIVAYYPDICQIQLETLTCVFQIVASNSYCVETIIADTYDIFVLNVSFDFEFIYISLLTAVVAE